ncbi:cytochrome p450 705a5 [Quercus suber]|uniref:Cytochrome p450 705a5 n=1 Tax=Quercus suber TaxID=58331 RepID=A0AAW0L5S5_QUESU
MATEIFKTNDLAYAYQPHFTFVDTLPYGNYGFSWHPMVIIGDSSENPCMTELLSIQRIEQSHGVRQEEIALFLRKVFQCAKKKQVVDVRAELMKLTNNITCRVIMSMRCSDESNEAVRIRVSKGGL